ncbi:hypothetical protein [Flavobacterium sandaracinum]|uniref:DUF4402 domain-containing protein n=1 Tax=Flavobacterium sandaracinum TaxID=2541733 RepID=A0A4R5D6W6_9FLAO|nr:hypothetical protein [Flavobacterium sandaracinum]TDE05913.1 hypothetical protein E0F91_04840 [Flavobacterium sandaracinum]
MRKLCIITVSFLLSFSCSQAQILAGTLNVTGMPSFTQSVNAVVVEAGLDDTTVGFESNFDATKIGFVLNPILLLPSSLVCEQNVYRYSVFINSVNTPANVTLEAKTTVNSGLRFPTVSIYDTLLIQPLGPRNLTPTNGGNYTTVPNNATQAIKIMEFIGCRQDIPIQFRIKPSALCPAGNYNFEINYTVTASLTL